MMKRFWMMALVACAGLDAGVAQADDRNSALADRAYNWTGVYTGVHAGYGFGSTESPGSPHLDHGAIGGAQLGYNQQIGNLLFGIETDFTFAGIRGTRIIDSFGQATLNQTTRTNWLATATGRVGFARGSWLAYAKAGAAWANEDHSFDVDIHVAPGGRVSLSGNETRNGWIVGAGLEYALAGNWSVRAEYNFINFARNMFDLSGTDNTGAALQSSNETSQTLHLAKLGVNYQFGAPAEAKPIGPLTYATTEFDWTGLHVGAQAGYGMSRVDWRNQDPNGAFTGTGGFAGVQLGADVQLGVAVFGVEAELLGGRIDGGTSFTDALATTDLKSRTEWLAMATARFGMVTNDRWLTYVKAGVAVAQDRHEAASVQAPAHVELSGTRMHTGLVAGVGVEYAFARNWSAKLEYNYIDFGGEQTLLDGYIYAPPTVGNASFPNEIEKTMQIGKIGINYHFVP